MGQKRLQLFEILPDWQWILLWPVATSLITALSTLLLASIHFYYKNKFTYWEQRGIKGPTPWPVIGNFADQLIGNRLRTELKNVEKYGKIYGVYWGSSPRLVCADPEIMVHVCVKDFDVFPNRVEFEFQDQYGKAFVFNLRDEHWKRVRALMSPTFTSGKIKRMFRFLDSCADDLVKCFEEQLEAGKRATINIKETYSLFSMDAIATCCYGLKLKRAEKATNLKTAASRDEFVAAAMKFFDFSSLRILAAVVVPKPILRLINFNLIDAEQQKPLARKVRSLIAARRVNANQQKFDDYLQLLLDAKLDHELELDDMDSAENHHAGLTHESLRRDQEKLLKDLDAVGRNNSDKPAILSSLNKTKLTDVEIQAGAMILLAVGLETTGSLLTLCTYALAFHPELQKKLHEVLLRIVECDEEKSCFRFEYEPLTSCKYLDAVLSETMRLLPPVVSLDRHSNDDYYIEKYKLHLPAKSDIQLALYALLNDPDYWNRPEVFDPERFMPENKEKIVPGSYCPFGLGPRHCIGMRFSLTEAKLALAKIVMNFRFEPAPGAQWPPEPKAFAGLNSIKTPFVVAIKRDNRDRLANEN